MRDLYDVFSCGMSGSYLEGMFEESLVFPCDKKGQIKCMLLWRIARGEGEVWGGGGGREEASPVPHSLVHVTFNFSSIGQ